MLGHLNYDQIEEVLQSQYIARIGCHVNGETYVVPVTYAYHEGYIYCHSAIGKKINMMRDNHEVCIEVEHLANMGNWQCVIAKGTYEELHGDDAAHGLQHLINRLSPVMGTTRVPESPNELFHTAFHMEETIGLKAVSYRIKLTEKSGRFEKK